VKKTISIFAMAMLVAAALMASEDWRGNNRVSGFVVDKNTGKPVPNAKVMLRIHR
jgi:hypothetical protein